MSAGPRPPLSRREHQIMEIVYRHGAATASEVQAQLPDPPSYSGVRALLRILEEKGHVRHEADGPRCVYRPNGSQVLKCPIGSMSGEIGGSEMSQLHFSWT